MRSVGPPADPLAGIADPKGLHRLSFSTHSKSHLPGENILDDLDLSQARRPGEEIKRINVDFPAWMVAALDKEARRLGVTRQSIIKMWLAERLQQE